MIIFANTGLRNAELRTARWHQANFLNATFQVGKAKTEGGQVIPLNNTALSAFQQLRSRWPDAKPKDFIFSFRAAQIQKVRAQPYWGNGVRLI
jgi:integrase